MKKLFLSIAGLLLVVLVGFGQITFKPSLGISYNNFSESTSGEFKAKPGAQIGAAVAFGKKFYIEPGIYYATKSSEFTSGSTSGTSSMPVSKDALIKGLRVPVAVGVGVLGNEESLVSLRAFGGGSGFFVTGVGDDLNMDNITSPTWGVFAGAGVNFWIMFAEVSYEWSVTDADTDKSNFDLGKCRTLFFTVGFRF